MKIQNLHLKTCICTIREFHIHWYLEYLESTIQFVETEQPIGYAIAMMVLLNGIG